MTFEQETLERVMRARTAVDRASASSDVAAVGAAEQQLRSGVTRLFAVAENYPELKSDVSFQRQLNFTPEEKRDVDVGALFRA